MCWEFRCGQKETNGKFQFDILMIWWDPRDYSSGCYFCMIKLSAYNKINKYKIKYPSSPSTIHLVPHSAEIPEPVFKELLFLKIQEYESGEDQSDSNDDFEIVVDSIRKGYKQHELNDLAWNLGLSKKA